MILLEFAMTPLAGSESAGAMVAKVIDVVDRSGLAYQLTPMGTIVEGEWDEVMAVLKRCHETMAADSPRISTTLRIDHRAGDASRIRSKVTSVERRLGRKLST